jgi:succinate dehydrogenase/fumarate reductase flavoprotein subunit
VDEVAPWRAAMRDLMWERVGLVRTGAGLAAALAALDDIGRRLDAVGVPGGPAYNLAWQSWLDARNQCLAARLIAASALARQESRGAHYRADHPARDDAGWLVSVRIARRGGEPAVWTEPVRLHRLRPGATPAPATVEIGD